MLTSEMKQLIIEEVTPYNHMVGSSVLKMMIDEYDNDEIIECLNQMGLQDEPIEGEMQKACLEFIKTL